MSETAANAESRLIVDRWHNTYIVACGAAGRQSAMQDAMERIDRCIAEDIPDYCARRLELRLDQGSPDVWLIRKLDLGFDVDISAHPADSLTQAISDALALRIAAVIEHGEEQDEVLHFPNRAAYQAQFALDLAAGPAWTKWYYEEFRSLAALPISRAIREMLTREPKEGTGTILQLTASARLDDILTVLTDNDAEAIYKLCFGGAQDADFATGTTASPDALSQWSGQLLEIWNEEAIRFSGSTAKFQTALWWLARTAVRLPAALNEPAAPAAVEGLLELRRVLGALRSSLAADRLVRDLVLQRISVEDAVATAIERGATAPENALRFLLKIAGGDVDWAAQATAALLRDELPAAQAILAGESMLSLFGGIFLLGPALAKFNDIIESAAAEGEQQAEPAGFLRYLILAKCLGHDRTTEAMSDPALRLLSGCEGGCLGDGRQPGSQLGPAVTSAALSKSLIEVMSSEGRCLLAEAVRPTLQVGEILLLRDLARNHWIYAAPLPRTAADREEALIAGIEIVQAATGNTPCLLLHSSLFETAPPLVLMNRQHCHLIADDPPVGRDVIDALIETGCIAPQAPLQRFAHMLRSSDPEFAYLRYGNLWPDFDGALDLFSTMLAHAVLREFARRLMGFQSSSPEHLCRNFLEGASTVRSSAERIAVELPQSPLSLILRLSGLSSQTYTVPWLEGREVCLSPRRE